MDYYKPRKVRPLRIVAMALRSLTKLLSAWPIMLIAAFVISPVGPHLRWSYTYRDVGADYRIYITCEYLGSRGKVHYIRGDHCPFITVIDRRDHP